MSAIVETSFFFAPQNVGFLNSKLGQAADTNQTINLLRAKCKISNSFTFNFFSKFHCSLRSDIPYKFHCSGSTLPNMAKLNILR